MIDTHAHVDLCERSIQEIVDNAANAGVTHIINVALNLETAEIGLKTHEKYPHIYPTVGLYPGEDYTEDTWHQLEKMVQSGRFVAIGEMGLDYFKMRTSKIHQQTALIKQLELARDYDMPVIIHNRHSESDMADIVTQFPTVKKVFHCFGSHIDFIKQVDTPLTYYSFTGTVTYAKKGKTISAVQQIPLERIMLETDCPYLTPIAYKGDENQPAYVSEIAKRIADIKGVDIATVIQETTQTASSFFKI